MELFEKCTFSGFKICVPYIGCHPQRGLLFQPNASDAGVVHGPHVKKHCSGRNLEDTIHKRGFPGDSVVKNLPAMQKMQETRVQSVGWKDPLEEGMQPTSVFFAGESNAQNSLSLARYSPYDLTHSDTTEAT